METDEFRNWFNRQGDIVKAAVLTAVIGLIGLCITGCFSILNSLIQRPAPSTNPTQVLLVINATPIPTFTALPTLTPVSTFTQIPGASSSSVTPPQPLYTETPVSSVTNIVEPPTESKFRVIWGNWILNFILYMPQSTWLVITIVLGIIFLVLGIAVFFSMAGTSSDYRGLFGVGVAVFVFTAAISQWGWWGILWGLLIFAVSMGLMFVPRLFGAMIGVTSGVFIGISIALFFMIWSGYLADEGITSWSIMGGAVGMLIGAVAIEGNIED